MRYVLGVVGALAAGPSLAAVQPDGIVCTFEERCTGDTCLRLDAAEFWARGVPDQVLPSSMRGSGTGLFVLGDPALFDGTSAADGNASALVPGASDRVLERGLEHGVVSFALSDVDVTAREMILRFPLVRFPVTTQDLRISDADGGESAAVLRVERRGLLGQRVSRATGTCEWWDLE